MEKIKISIIVPVYNVEKYLSKCLYSLVNQTLKDIEILIINDGSTDNSQKIINEYAIKYSKLIKSYVKKNGGLSSTRNFGLKEAKGEYIAFIDSDDYIDLDMCEKLYDFACSNKADIVCFDLKCMCNEKEISIMRGGTKEKVEDVEFMLGPSSAANKLYRRSLLEKINFSFKIGIWSEDIAIIPSLVTDTNKIYYLKECYYYYVRRDNSITNQLTYNSKTLDAIKSMEILKEIFQSKKLYIKYYQEIEYIFITNLLINLPLKIYNFDEGINDIIMMSNYIKKEYPNWVKNKHYKSQLTFKQKIYCNLFYYKQVKLVRFLYKIKHFVKR